MIRHKKAFCLLAGMGLILALAQVGAAQVIRHPRPQEGLETRWEWALQQPGSQSFDEGYWVGYSIKRLMGEFTFYVSHGTSTFSTTTSPWRLKDGPTLYEQVYGPRNAPEINPDERVKRMAKQALEEWDSPRRAQKKVIKDVALLFKFASRDSDKPSHLCFSSMDVTFDLEELPFIWLESAEERESFLLTKKMFAQSQDIAYKKRLLSAIGFHSDSQQVVPFLESVLKSRVPDELRGRAASELEDHPVPSSLGLLKQTALEDRSLDVRKRAVSALEDIEMGGAVDVLIEVARTADHRDIRRRAISTLGDIASRKAVVALGGNDRSAAVEALSLVADKHRNAPQAAYAAFVLGHLYLAQGSFDEAATWFDVAFEVEYLLPCAEHEGTFADRDGKRGTHDRCLQVRMAVAVVPGPFVPVIPARRHKLIENIRQILDEARFVFDCTDRTCAAHIEQVDNTGIDAGTADNVLDVTGNLVHLAMVGCCERYSFLMCHLAPFPLFFTG